MRRREYEHPYGMNTEGRLYRYNPEREVDEMVNDGGYRDGVLIDRDLEEEEFGAFTEEQYDTARRAKVLE